MKRLTIILLSIGICMGLIACASSQQPTDIAATTLSVYEFTARLCRGTDIQVTRLITESIACLHDYSIQAKQMQAIEDSKRIIISGAGLEDFLGNTLIKPEKLIDASANIEMICSEGEHDHTKEHNHEQDPHIWLSPANAKIMAQNIFQGLLDAYPEHKSTFEANLQALEQDLDNLANYAKEQLSNLSSNEIICFHDGFSYMAEAFGLTICRAIEEESGSEASAAELIEIIELVREHNHKVIFTERNSSSAAANIICAETGAAIYQLDMAMSGDSYFDAMYYNINTLKEALE